MGCDFAAACEVVKRPDRQLGNGFEASSKCGRSTVGATRRSDDGLALRIMSGDDAAYFECHGFPHL
jgi:hypothetical protein